MRNLIIFMAVILLIATFILWGCDTHITLPEQVEPYYIEGALAKNLDLDSIFTSLVLKRNDTIVETADITLDGDTLDFMDNYYIAHNSAAALPSENYYLYIDDGDFRDSVRFIIPTDLSITGVALPEDRVNPAGGSVQIDWSLSPGNDGYIVGVILRDSSYIAAGYSFFSPGGVPQANIPPDAFRLYADLDTGWYNVHVYSFTGWPAFDDNLPTALPAGFTDTIGHLNLSGKFGTLVVSRRDSIHVVEGL